MTGHWPYKLTHPIEEEDKSEYEDRVMASMKQGRHPDVGGVIGGTIMVGCWTKQYVTADEILQALKVEMREGAAAAAVVAAAAGGGGGRPERERRRQGRKQRRQGDLRRSRHADDLLPKLALEMPQVDVMISASSVDLIHTGISSHDHRP